MKKTPHFPAKAPPVVEQINASCELFHRIQKSPEDADALLPELQ